MDYAKAISVVECTMIVAVLITSAAFLKAPENMAVLTGERVVLECESDTTQALALGWKLFWSNGTNNTIVGCNTPSNILDGYEVEDPIGPACNLIILSATTSQAGQYSCTPQQNQNDSATSQFIVLESVPQCQTDPSGFANVSETVTMSCSVNCHGNTTTGPVMTWFDPTGLEVSASNTGSSLSPNYVTHVSASIQTVHSYTCNTKFNSTPQSSGSNPATNIPTYNSTCVTQDIIVQYPPYKENITITPDSSGDLYIGSTLTCNATTVPPVTMYQWMNESDEIISNSTVLTLDQIGEYLEYTCAVWNDLGSNLLSVIVNVTVPASNTPTTTTSGQGGSSSQTSAGSQSTTMSGPATGSDNTGVIVGAVLGSLVALALVILLIVCCCVESCALYDTCRDNKQDKYADQSSSDNSSGDYPNPADPQSYSSQEQMVLDSRMIGLGVIHTAASDKEEFHVQYAELQFDPSVANRRLTHTGSHIPYYDEHNNIITTYNEEETIYSYPKSA